jgi:hypothetical protein
MARTNLPLTSLTANSATLNNAGTAIDATNGMNVALSSSAIPSAASADRLVFYVLNTTASTKTVTVRKGDNTAYLNVPAFEASKGDLTTGNLNATTGSAFIGPFELARFVQSGGAGADQPAGSINVDFAAGMTGTIWAILLPKGI